MELTREERLKNLARWAGIDPERLETDENGRITSDADDTHFEFEVGLVCDPGRRCCPPNDRDDDGTRWLSPSYSPFTDPVHALQHAQWQAFHNYGSEHKPVLRYRSVTEYQEF